MNSVSLIVFILFVSTVGSVSAKCHLKELDFCSASLMIFLQNQETPTTEPAIDNYCRQMNQAQECVANFTSKCATDLQRELIGYFTVGGVNVVNEFCSASSPLRSNYLANAKCLSEANKEAGRCLKDLQVATEEVTSTAWEKRLSMGCCAFNRFQDCTFSIVANRCGSHVVDLGRKVMSMVTSRVPETVCRSFATKSDLCVNILPLTGQVPRGNKSTSLVARLFATFVGN